MRATTEDGGSIRLERNRVVVDVSTPDADFLAEVMNSAVDTAERIVRRPPHGRDTASLEGEGLALDLLEYMADRHEIDLRTVIDDDPAPLGVVE